MAAVLNLPSKVLQALDISSKPVSAAQFLLQVLSGISVSSVLRLVFGERASLAVASVCAAAMWWHLLSISEAHRRWSGRSARRCFVFALGVGRLVPRFFLLEERR